MRDNMKTKISPKSLLKHGFVKVRLPNGQIIYLRNGVAIMWAHYRWFYIVLINGAAYLQQMTVAYVEDIP